MILNPAKIKRYQKRLFFIAIDSLLSILSTWIALALRLNTTNISFQKYIILFILSLSIYLIIFYIFSVYKTIFRYFEIYSIQKISLSILLIIMIYFIILYFFNFNHLPVSISILQPVIFLIFICIFRILFSFVMQNFFSKEIIKQENIIIYGAGSGGVESLSVFKSSNKYKVFAFIDDDKSKKNLELSA